MVKNKVKVVKSQKVRLQVMVPEHLLKLIWEERDIQGYDKTTDFLQNLISIGLAQLRNKDLLNDLKEDPDHE